jgi:hypothetical protein
MCKGEETVLLAFVPQMQITPSTVTLPTLAPAAGSANSGRDANALSTANQPTISHTVIASETDAVPQSDVSLSANASESASQTADAVLYAEIWKDGRKVAQVDSHGRVTSFSGSVAPAEGSSIGGPLRAALRATQVAQAVGGEIRVAGQVLDGATLSMRARLAQAYKN